MHNYYIVAIIVILLLIYYRHGFIYGLYIDNDTRAIPVQYVINLKDGKAYLVYHDMDIKIIVYQNNKQYAITNKTKITKKEFDKVTTQYVKNKSNKLINVAFPSDTYSTLPQGSYVHNVLPGLRKIW